MLIAEPAVTKYAQTGEFIDVVAERLKKAI
jgi:hypothetical protein